MPYRKEVRRKIGRRGASLIFAGAAWALTGFQITQDSRPRFSNGGESANEILAVMDSPAWGWTWIITGLCAVITGFFRHRRPLLGRDDIGYTLIMFPPFIWTVFFGWSWVANLMSDGFYGRDSALYGLVVWATIAAFVFTIAGWPEIEDFNDLELVEVKPQAGRHRDSG